jgi:protein-L-isoaspartate O-methyltransferase
VFHRLAPTARVVGIEHIKGLADKSKDSLTEDGITLGKDGVEIILGDGRKGELYDPIIGIVADTTGSPDHGTYHT